jgi:hypothetical protein
MTTNNDQQNVSAEAKISIDRMISLIEEQIRGMEKRSFTPEQQIMLVLKLKNSS